MTASRGVYDIREDEIDIKGKPWDHDDVKLLWTKRMLSLQKKIDFWEPLIDRGRNLFDVYDGEILSDEARSYYEDVEDKIVVEPPIAKSPIRALVGQFMKGRRSGSVTTEGGSLDNPSEAAEEIGVMNAILKDLEIKTKEKYRIRDAVHDTFVSGVPNVLVYEKAGPEHGSACGSAVLTHLPWDSCVLGPVKAKETDGSDYSELAYFDYFNMYELMRDYPDMKKQIRNHFKSNGYSLDADSKLLSSLKDLEGTIDADELNGLYNIVSLANGGMDGLTGMVPTVVDLYPTEYKMEVFSNIFDDTGEDFVVLPENWKEKDKRAWLEQNRERYRGPYIRPVRTLWYTVYTTSGLVLANESHWFQEYGRLNASVWLGAKINNKPTCPMVDMADDVLMNTVAEIEYLDAIRKGSGSLLVAREGAIANPESIPSERSKTKGHMFVKQDAPGSIQDNIQEIPTQFNGDIWKVYGEQRKQNMAENTRLNETMQGQSAPRQAAIAKNIEIAQALIVNAIYIDNVNLCWENHQNLKLSIVPYIYTEEEAIEIQDEESGQEQAVSINQVSEYDMDGNPISVVNDITSKRYKWKLNAVDDSPTAKQMQMEEAMVVINSTAGPLTAKDQSGTLFARFLMAMPNPLLKAAGREMAKDAQMQSEQQGQMEQQKALQEANIEMQKAKADLMRAEKQGKSVSITGEQLAQYPNLFALLQQWGLAGSSANMLPHGQPGQPLPPSQDQAGGVDALAM